jgi:hypothetical protein
VRAEQTEQRRLKAAASLADTKTYSKPLADLVLCIFAVFLIWAKKID